MDEHENITLREEISDPLDLAKQSKVFVGCEHQHSLPLALHPGTIMRADFRFERINALILGNAHFAVQTREVGDGILFVLMRTGLRFAWPSAGLR